MLRRIAAGLELAQQDAALREAQVILGLAHALKWGAQTLLHRHWRWVAWAMFRSVEGLGRMARRILEREMWRRR